MPVGMLARIFLVENDFALEPARRFGLAAIKLAAEQGEDSRQPHQPDRQQRHAPDEIVHRFVGDGFRLLDHRHPAGRFDRTERIKISRAARCARFCFGRFLSADFARWAIKDSDWLENYL